MRLEAMPLLPPDHDLELIHTRSYETKVYLVDNHLVARGAVRDRKPAGLLVEDDPDTIDMHHMVLELAVTIPDLTITAVALDFQSFPNATCPSISDAYQQLVGLSIARGFTHRIRELFGGPRGCTHVVALLQALAPSVVQATWSLGTIERRRSEAAGEVVQGFDISKFQLNTNTCHIWAEDGEYVALVRRGEIPDPPLPVAERMVELGRDLDSWRGT